MKTSVSQFILSCLTIALLAGCSKDGSDNITPTPTANANYVLMTDLIKLGGSGYFTAFTSIPTGTVTPITSKALQIKSAYGFRAYGKWFFNRSNAAGELGLQKYTVADDGSIVDGGFIAGSTQYVIATETSGYYLDETRGTLKIQKFNPTTMQRTGEIDLSSLQKSGVEYQVIGKHTLATKEGKLYAGITYGTKKALGYGDDLYNYIEFAVIDMATDKLDKTIKYDGLKGIGWGGSGNKMWSIGDDGALYLYSTALGIGFTSSSVIRIKKGETDFDRNWILKANDLQNGASIATALVKGGKIYIELPSTPLEANFSNLNSSIFDYYAVDLTTGQKTKIEGMPQHDYARFNDHAITEIDGKIHFWVRNPSQKVDGYYALDGTKATQVFNVAHDGSLWGFVKLQ